MIRASLSRPGIAAALAVAALLTGRVAFAEEIVPFPRPPKEWPQPHEDNPIVTFLLVDQLEYRRSNHDDSRNWDIQGWVGGDWNKFWFKTEGDRRVGGPMEEAEVQALYARLISPFWYLQAGIRYDDRPQPMRRFAVLGVQGLAAYWFNIEATAFTSDEGDTSARLKAEYDLLFTQRLVLQPRIETNLAFSSDDTRRVGKGLNDVDLGLRLRYEIRREFAPYIGVTWRKAFGDTADLTRRAGEDVERRAIVAGVRFWF